MSDDSKPRAYLMYNGSQFYLCFGKCAVSAGEGLRVYGEDPDTVGVSQGVDIVEGEAFKIIDVYGSPLLKTICRVCHGDLNLSFRDYCPRCAKHARVNSESTEGATR